MAESMITIKKADGTFAKVPLSEFKKMQAAQKPPAPAVSPKPVVHHAVKPHPAPHYAKPPDSATPARPDGHSDGASPGKMSRVDAGSPLEEKLPPPTAGSRLMAGKITAPLFSPKREKQVEEVMANLGFSVAPEVLGRLKSLVLARLKDIKSEYETRELLARSIKNGGLGLTEQQVEKIIKSCREVESEGGKEEAEAPVLKGKTNMSLMVEPPELPMVISPKETVSKLINESVAREPVFKLNTRPTMKQSMQDISASSVEMGPVEEIKSMTLIDFRRLSGNPEEAAKRIAQKMFNLQEESFVWYLEVLAAYRASPLYTEYMQSVSQSLAERKSLANVLSMKNSIKLNEIMALVEMERSL